MPCAVPTEAAPALRKAHNHHRKQNQAAAGVKLAAAFFAANIAP
jgi:hypothetical protein